MKKRAVIQKKNCVACGCCVKVCPRSAISVPLGIHAEIDYGLCVGCGKCVKECPANIITLDVTEKKKKKRNGMISFGLYPLHT